MEAKERKELEEELARLREELADRKKALPQHSIRPWQLQEIEELEDKIKEIKKKLGEG